MREVLSLTDHDRRGGRCKAPRQHELLYQALPALLASMLFLPEPAAASDIPVVARASDGPCRMTISGGGEYFAVEVTGLAPGEDLVFESVSEGEAIKSGTNASQSGTYESIVIPLVEGKTSGTATVIVTGSRCRIQASYPWRE